MKTIHQLFILIGLSITIHSCSKEEMGIKQEDFRGEWELKEYSHSGTGELLTPLINVQAFFEATGKNVQGELTFTLNPFNFYFNGSINGEEKINTPHTFQVRTEYFSTNGDFNEGSWSLEDDKMILENQDGSTIEVTVEKITASRLEISYEKTIPPQNNYSEKKITIKHVYEK
ncbi:MAG: hypothetical protein R2879_12995 [Saprospiraceae bacterium]